MSPEDYQKVKSLFNSALELNETEREKFLTENCADNSDLRRAVERLLASHKNSSDFIESPAIALVSENILEDKNNGSKNLRLGNYKIEREIGRGGMGSVYLATRSDDQFNKRVAIKILRRGMDTEDILRRFRNERRILAALDHPNIARLLDAGTTDDGLPYFVMEYVEGEAIDKYCDEHNLTTKERLQLFRKVCSAVQYAHQNLIVHRDLKPSNIIVTDKGEPKLLDFGIAKLLNPELTAHTIAPTATFVRLMTPDYASPEQIRGKNITTASDIYSLGILLYKLLTGQQPYHFQDSSPQEIERVICESQPTKPSAVVRGQESGIGEKSSGQRTADSGQFTNPKSKIQNPKSLKGDLDNIVLMALRKEPERRYRSVEHFSQDIERHLKGLPVAARPNTFAYRAEKFIRRNKVGVIAASLIVLAVLIGLIATVWQARVAARERDQARREKAKAELLNNFLQSMLGASNPDARPSGRDLTVKEILDEASKRLATEDLASQPEVKAELQRIIAISYLSLGQYDLAEKNLSAALESQIKLYGEDNLETLKTMVLMAQLWTLKGDNTKADKFYRQRLSILRTEQKQGTIHTDYLITALNDFALIRRGQGDSKEAETLLREALSLRSQASPETQTGFHVLDGVLALTLADQGNFDEAIKIVRGKVAALRGQSNVATHGLSANLTGLGSFLIENGNYVEAEESLREAETIYRKLFNPSFLALGDNLRLQAQCLYEQGKYAEAESKINETLEIYKKTTNTKYFNYATALTIQGLIYSKTNRAAEAEKLLREAVRIRAENLPEAHFIRAVTNGLLGEFLTTQKRYAEAEPLLLNSYGHLKNSQTANSPRIKLALQRLVTFFENSGKTKEANEYRMILAQNQK